MPHQQHNENHTTHNYTIPTEGLESITGNEPYEELDGQQGYHKGNYVAQQQSTHVAHNQIGSFGFGKQFQYFITHCRKHGRHCQKERELGCRFARKFLCHTSHNGCHRTGYTRYHGYTLKQAYIKCALLGKLGLIATLVEYPIAEEHENTANNQHDGNNYHIFEQGVDPVAQGQTEYGSRNEGDQQLPVEIIGVQEPPLGQWVARERSAVEPEKPFPIETYHRQNGSKLYNYRKCPYKGGTFYTKNTLCNNHVPRRGNGQKLGQSLYYGDNNRF